MKVLKIIPVYFGTRRGTHASPTNPVQILQTVLKSVRYEKSIDPGVKMDTLIYFNGNLFPEMEQKVKDYAGQLTCRGRFIFANRENSGGSFGAFSQGFDTWRSKYDYFIFCEDDIIIHGDHYAAKAIQQFNQDDRTGFIAFSPISHGPPLHCGGGFGLSSKQVLSKCAKIHGRLPFNKEVSYPALEQNEVEFTNSIVRMGYNIVQSQDFNPLATNWKDHFGQRQYSENKEFFTKKSLYTIGSQWDA